MSSSGSLDLGCKRIRLVSFMLLHFYSYMPGNLPESILTLILLTWTKWRAPTNASKWRMGFNSAFKGLKEIEWAERAYKKITHGPVIRKV